VDDNAVNLLVGRRILGMFGYDKVETAADGQLAVQAAEKNRYDVILMDL
jgi:CheY-like chemotaxis protein